jgi:hypothetical protein
MHSLTVGNGAKFWAYVSPQNDTKENVTNWSVTIEQGDWSGTITSGDPYEQLQTSGMSGIFKVTVTGSGPQMPQQTLTVQDGSNPEVGCNSNCAAMVGIVSSPDGTSAQYWTVWNAFCSRSES